MNWETAEPAVVLNYVDISHFYHGKNAGKDICRFFLWLLCHKHELPQPLFKSPPLVGYVRDDCVSTLARSVNEELSLHILSRGLTAGKRLLNLYFVASIQNFLQGNCFLFLICNSIGKCFFFPSDH